MGARPKLAAERSRAGARSQRKGYLSRVPVASVACGKSVPVESSSGSARQVGRPDSVGGERADRGRAPAAPVRSRPPSRASPAPAVSRAEVSRAPVARERPLPVERKPPPLSSPPRVAAPSWRRSRRRPPLRKPVAPRPSASRSRRRSRFASSLFAAGPSPGARLRPLALRPRPREASPSPRPSTPSPLRGRRLLARKQKGT